MNQRSINSNFFLSITCSNSKNVATLLEQGADVHYLDDFALRYIMGNYHFQHQHEKLALLLAYEANIYVYDSACLKYAQTIFDKEFDEELANVLLPYCREEDYHYFPEVYIKTKIVSIKSAANI